MKRATITLIFRQLIDINTEGTFARNVFNYSYRQLLTLIREYDPEGITASLKELTEQNPDAGNLHFHTAAGIKTHFSQLAGIMPLFTDNSGGRLFFNDYEFEILNADFTDGSTYSIAIGWYMRDLVLLDSFGNYLLLQKMGEEATFMVKLQDGVSISSWVVADVPLLT